MSASTPDEQAFPWPDDLDVEALFAPLSPEEAFDVVLSETSAMLARVHDPIDAELWGSDMIAAVSGGGSGPRAESGTRPGGGSGGGDDLADAMRSLTELLVPAAEKTGSPESLALLRILGALGTPELREAAAVAAERMTAQGVADPDWAESIGSPEVRDCWFYSDASGQQESVSLSFAYGQTEHAVSVLIDHALGGRIKDAWVGDARELLAKTRAVAKRDPTLVFDMIDVSDARGRLERALAAGECPEQADQVEDVAAHRALLRVRLELLNRLAD
jgi:hypothetical protein